MLSTFLDPVYVLFIALIVSTGGVHRDLLEMPISNELNTSLILCQSVVNDVVTAHLIAHHSSTDFLYLSQKATH